MIFYYINGTDRSEDIEANTLSLSYPLQQRSDKCSFSLFEGIKPTENQDVKIYDGALVASHSGDEIVLQDSFQVGFNAFRAGQFIFIDIGGSDQMKVEVDSFDEDTRTITLTADPGISLSSGDRVGELIFGGVVSRVVDNNLHSLDNIEYSITCVGYVKIFDKQLVADVWLDVDVRYIVNEFVNSFVNYNITLNNLSYASNLAIAAALTEGGDGANPTIDSTDFMEGDSSADLDWTFASGTATWAFAITSTDLSILTGASSGTPVSGEIMLWAKTADFADITGLKVRVGSDSSNYAELTFELVDSADWQYLKSELEDSAVTGTPDWTAIDYVQVRVAETASGEILLNGLRLNQDNSFTCFNLGSSPTISEYRASNMRPSAIINGLAKAFEYVWYIDAERDIHFAEKSVQGCFYQITDSSDNFANIGVEVDASQLGNRIIVRGGEEISSSYYTQVIEGSGFAREWLLKAKFSDLSMLLDDNSSTDTMELATTTTTVKATAHGLSVGDHVVMRSRNNVVREVLTVPDADTFTVEAVTSQAAGDTFSKFATAVTIGVEGLTDETTVNYVGNSNEKSVRATANTATLNTGSFLRFKYKERVPIQVRYSDPASQNALLNAGIGNGIFDLDPFTDSNIQDRNTAILVAEAKVNEFSNAVISGGFETNFKGFKVGDILTIRLTDRGIDSTFLVQRVTAKQKGGKFFDHFNITVEFGTTVFGIVEFYQKLLRARESFSDNTDDIVVNFVDANEEISLADTNRTTSENLKSSAEEISLDDTNATNLYAGPWQWETSAGQPVTTRWNLFEWE